MGRRGTQLGGETHISAHILASVSPPAMAEPVDTMPSKEREAKGVPGPAKDGGKDAKAPAALPTQALGGTAIKPEGWDRTGWESFKYTLYDPKAGTILTRTPLSWLKITVFYCIYYSCLAGFWIACLNVFFATLPEVHDGPRWLQADSIIGVNPGVGLRPRNTDARIDSQMFVLRQGDTNTHQSEQEGEGDLNADYVARTDKFLKNYETTDSDGRPIKMGKRRNADGEEESYPTFSLSQLGDCSKANNYGYVVKDAKDLVKPCIFIKLNTIWGWTPKPLRLRQRESGPR